MTSLQDLLPDPDSSVLCADFSRSLNLDPGGTAIRADRVVLIETPLPWPKPVFDHPLLSGIKPAFDRSDSTTRVLASVPYESTENGENSDQVTVRVFDRNDKTTTTGPHRRPHVDHYQFQVAADGLLALAERLAAHPIGSDPSEEIVENLRTKTIVDTPILMVCTQGSHDICCGGQGTRFANEAQGLADVAVYKVSHTGGHRFAPTAMTLPDGRMWANLTVEMLQQIVTQAGSTRDVAENCRGWWGADRGPAQVAERAVFAEAGWGINSLGRSAVAIAESSDDASATQRWKVVVGESGDSWEVVVSVGRHVPSIACHSPGGLPAKPSVEYRVDSVRKISGEPS